MVLLGPDLKFINRLEQEKNELFFPSFKYYMNLPWNVPIFIGS